MARIAIIKLFYGMTITTAQLSGELKAHGHDAKVIIFKRQASVLAQDRFDEKYQLGDVPMLSYMVSRKGAELFESSIWNKVKPAEIQNLKRTLREYKPDAIGISTLSLGMTLAAELTEELRKDFDQPVLWGGTGPTIEPDRSIASADLVCVGEGEEVLIEIAERLDKKQRLDGIAGTWFREGENIQKNPKRPVSDLDKIAMPDWNPETYVFINGHKCETPFRTDTHLMDKSYQIMTQRGCPFSCSFCVESFYQNEFGKKDSLRRMKPEKAIAELKVAKEKYGYKTVTFMDDVFTVNPRWLEKFLAIYKQEIDLPFFCYTYPTTHSPKILKMLFDAGCRAMSMGVQSGSERILTEIYNRPTHIDRVVQAAQDIVDSGIPAATFDMIPRTAFDTEQDLINTFELLLKMPKELDTTFYAQMAYFPNYPIQDNFKNDNILAKAEALTEDDYAYYFKFFNLTRSEIPMDKIREMFADPRFREDHNRLNPYLKDDHWLKPNYGTLIDYGVELMKQKKKSA